MPAERSSPEQKRKPRTHHAPYKPRQSKPIQDANLPRTSAQSIQHSTRVNLTLHDWFTVFRFIDEHPGISQDAIVQHFKTLRDGALIFDQSTLSRKLKDRRKLEERARAYPNALSSKRVRIVTSPAVDRALFLWVKHMEEKREHVTGAMLVAKRATYEEQFDVPVNERLQGDGWLANFKRAYGIKEFRRHGEAGSVDPAVVEIEQGRLRAILANYEPKNILNFDETGINYFAPPDRGLATQQMSGKKKDKSRITIGLACNADGSEKLPILFIGRSAKPRCFKGRTPKSLGFNYENNKTVWMTKSIFEEWLKSVDLDMRSQNRHICLLIDNFSGHYIDYQPQNIQIVFFEPNLTSHIQPCDAGIIRTTKALFRKAFCLRAVELDELGEREIYKTDLLESMRMITEAWNAVKPSTIANCWDHTKILPKSKSSAVLTTPPNAKTSMAYDDPMKDPCAWEVIYNFATTDMRLPVAHENLKTVLGNKFVLEKWSPIFDIVFGAENDIAEALQGLDKVTNQLLGCRISEIAEKTIPSQESTNPTRSVPPQLAEMECDLLRAVEDLKQRKRIIGTALTLEEILTPVDEKEIGDSTYRFEGGDEEIVAQVNHEMAVKRGDIVEVESDEEDSTDCGIDMGHSDIIQLCEQMEPVCISYGSEETSLDLCRRLRKFRMEIRKQEQAALQQPTLSRWFGPFGTVGNKKSH